MQSRQADSCKNPYPDPKKSQAVQTQGSIADPMHPQISGPMQDEDLRLYSKSLLTLTFKELHLILNKRDESLTECDIELTECTATRILQVFKNITHPHRKLKS